MPSSVLQLSFEDECFLDTHTAAACCYAGLDGYTFSQSYRFITLSIL